VWVRAALRLPGHRLRRAANYMTINSFLKTNRRDWPICFQHLAEYQHFD